MESADAALSALSTLVHGNRLSKASCTAVYQRLTKNLANVGIKGLPPRRTEQSHLVLLVTMFETQEASSSTTSTSTSSSRNNNITGPDRVCKMLSSISADSLAWVDAFENGFISAIFLEMIKFDCFRQSQQVSMVLVDLLGQIASEIWSSDASHSVLLSMANILINVVTECDTRLVWTQNAVYADRILLASQALVKFTSFYTSSGELPSVIVELTAAALRACNRIISSPGCNQEAVAECAVLATEVLALDSGHTNVTVKRDANVLLASCALLDAAHIASSIQQGLKFLNQLSSLRSTHTHHAASNIQSANASKNTRLEMAAIVQVVQVLRKSARDESRQTLSVPLSRACLYAHLDGELFGAGFLVAPELQALSALVFEMFIDELQSTSFAESQCKWFIITCLEFSNELLNEHAVILSSTSSQKHHTATKGCLARVLPFFCAVPGKIRVPELTASVYYSLVELLNHPASSDFSKEIAEQIVAVAVADCADYGDNDYRDKGKYLLLAEEMFCCTFSRSLGMNQTLTGDYPTLFKSTFQVLAGVSRGLLLITKHYQTADEASTARIRDTLVALFENIATDIYARPSSTGCRERGIALGNLLAPLAASFWQDRDQQIKLGGMASLRNFWYALVIFRLKERESWNHFPEWLTAYQTLAARCPPLTLGSDGAAFLEKELSCSNIFQGMAAASQTNLAPVWSKVAHFPIRGLTFPQIMYGVTIQYLESLRVGGSLDVRPMLTYLLDEGVESTPWLRKTIISLSDHVFTVWLEAASMQMHGSLESSAPSWRIRSVVGLILEFLVGHCAHHSGLIRSTALRFTKRTLARVPWLMWTPTAVFILLDSIQALLVQARGIAQSESYIIDSMDQGSPDIVSFGAYAAEAARSASLPNAVIALDPNECDGARLRNGLLPPSALPRDSATISLAVKDMLELAHEWLTAAAKTMPAELDTIIQEYLLMERVQGTSAHVGVGLANALTSSTSDGKKAYISKLAESALTSIGSIASSYSDSFTAELTTKTLYIGEIMGMFQSDGDEAHKIAWNKPLSRPMSSFISLAEKLGANLAMPFSDVVPCTWHCLALIHNMAAVLMQPAAAAYVCSGGGQEDVQAMWDALHRLVHLVSSCAVARFSKPVIEALILGWRWLFLSYPRLRNRVLYESMSMLRWTCQQRIGMFADDDGDVSEKCAHEIWITFLEKTISAFGDHDGVAFFFMETILSTSSSRLDKLAASSLTPRFRLLSLALKVIEAAAQTAKGPSIDRRRALRERVIFCAVDWFDTPSLVTPIDPLLARESHSVLSTFLCNLLADAERWSAEYDDSTAINGATEQRAAGADAATSFLQQSVGLDLVVDDLLPPGQFDSLGVGEMVVAQRSLGIAPDESSSAFSLSQPSNAKHGYRSGTLLLLQMLLLHEMDRFAAWGGTDGDKDRRALAALSNINTYKIVIKSAWCVSPGVAFALANRFPKLESRDGQRKGLSHLALFLVSGSALGHQHWAAVPVLYDCIRKLTLLEGANSACQKFANLRAAGYEIDDLRQACLSKLVCWSEAPAHMAIDMLNRLHGKADDALYESQPPCVEIVRYALRSLKAADQEEIVFFLPQLVQLLRRDEHGVIGHYMKEICQMSTLVCHMAMWALLVESEEPESVVADEHKRHGYCKKLLYADPLPSRASALVGAIRLSLSPAALVYLDSELTFFSQVTNISAMLKAEKNKTKHNEMCAAALAEIKFSDGLYMPTEPYKKVVGVDVKSGTPMQSAARCPFRLTFRTQPWNGPDDFLAEKKSSPAADSSCAMPSPRKFSNARRLSLSTPSPGPSPAKRTKADRAALSLAREQEHKDAREEEEAEGTSQCIFKVYDDIRQDALTVQVLRILKDQWAAIGIPLYVTPYSIIPTRTGADRALGGIIQVVPSKSRDQIGKSGGAKTLLKFFTSTFGVPGSDGFMQAQAAFASSLAGYAVLCHLLSVKDRHNGNVLIDTQGHIIHIDFGFLLGISPGGNLGFEAARFKLTDEMVELMGGEKSDLYGSFVEMACRGFLAARQVMEPLMAVVASFADSGQPCFTHSSDNLRTLRSRFVPEMSTSEAVQFMDKCIQLSKCAPSTDIYDLVQKYQNGIF